MKKHLHLSDQQIKDNEQGIDNDQWDYSRSSQSQIQ